MTNKKISALTPATTPLAGTETLPVVQSSTTKQVSVADLTTGRVVSGTSFSATTSGFQAYSGTNILIEMKYLGGAIINRFLGTTFYLTENGISHITVAPTSGDVTVNIGNIIQGTAAKGINFTANTSAAGKTSQLLNWYEEGTWTPNQGADVTVVGTYSSRGTYTRIGQQVYITGFISGSTSISCAAGGALTSNLPFNNSPDGPIGRALTANTGIFCDIYPSSVTLYTANVALSATGYIRFSITIIV